MHTLFWNNFPSFSKEGILLIPITFIVKSKPGIQTPSKGGVFSLNISKTQKSPDLDLSNRGIFIF